MPQRTCDECGALFSPTHARNRYCESHSGRRAHKLRARVLITCVTCGCQHRSARTTGKYCSALCRDYDKWGARTSAWPRAQRHEAKPKPPPFAEARDCQWCGIAFTARIRSQVFCSADHKVKAKRYRRRGQQYGSTSHFTWAEFMRLFLSMDKRCAYCEQPIEGQPDPDHVVPLSKGGSNSITNILPACRSCNSDKRDLLLSEWAFDRARRSLQARRTDPRCWPHLTDAVLAA